MKKFCKKKTLKNLCSFDKIANFVRDLRKDTQKTVFYNVFIINRIRINGLLSKKNQ
ncbi:MAG: hypothetical protein RL757_2342 [Bacteroidota bacterium]|jgi:hypothetical protein